MAQNKRRPKYIEKQLSEINEIFHQNLLKYNDHYNDPLFKWFTFYLLHHGWYRGFNMYYDITDSDGNVRKVLAGENYEDYNYYLQIW